MTDKLPIYVTSPLLPEFDKIQDYLRQIWSSKLVTNHGEFHNLLEVKLKEHLKVPHLSIFNNGTIALIAALRALNLPHGSEVVTTGFTFPATPHAISWCGLKPIFCDIDPIKMTIDPDKIEQLITPKTSAILGVHVYGQPCAVDRIEKIAEKYNVKVIYDAAHAFSTEIDGRGIGTFGDITMFSFHATKLYNTIEGGALTYNDKSLVDIIYKIRNFGIVNEDQVDFIGINGKMNEIQAAIGLINLEQVTIEINKRKIVKQIYDENLSNVPGIAIIQFPTNVSHSMQYYVIRINQSALPNGRDCIHTNLKKHNIFSRKYFYPPCTEYSPYKDLGDSKSLPETYKAAAEVLCLPLYGDLDKSIVKKICHLIKQSVNDYTILKTNHESLCN